MKDIVFSKGDFTDKQLRKIWWALCAQGIRNEVTWIPSAKKLDTVTVVTD